MTSTDLLADENIEKVLIRVNGIFYYISYVDIDEKCLLVMQTDLIGDNMAENELTKLYFKDLENQDVAVYKAEKVEL